MRKMSETVFGQKYMIRVLFHFSYGVYQNFSRQFITNLYRITLKG